MVRTMSSVKVVFGKSSPSARFYRNGKQISVDTAFGMYTKESPFVMGGKPVRFGAYEEFKAKYRAKPSGDINKLSQDTLGIVSTFLLPGNTGALAATSKGSTAELNEAMERMKEANAKLHEAIGLFGYSGLHPKWGPEEALKQVRQLLKTGHNVTPPNLNAVVKPWRYTTEEPKPLKNLLTQVIAHKFRSEFVYEYYAEDGNYSNIPPVQGPTRHNEDAEEIVDPVEARKLIDTSRFEIIKALLDKGATFNKQTVRMALSMKDAFTAVELFKRNAEKPPHLQIKDFWTFDGTESLNERPYGIQEIGTNGVTLVETMLSEESDDIYDPDNYS